MHLNQLVKQSHELARKKGFWDKDKSVPESLMLIVSELGEACEAHRCGDMDEFREEIADVFIRLGDFCGRHELDIESEIERKHNINKNRDYKHGKRY